MTRRSLPIAVVLAGVVGGGPAVHAHHSLAGMYDESTRVTLTGVVRQFQFVNPHPLLVVVVDGTTGPEEWRMEMDNKGELAEIGITPETFRAGDRVTAAGSPGHTTPRILYLRALDRASDGLHYEQVGFSPRLSRRR
jgi:hypothetical protein